MSKPTTDIRWATSATNLTSPSSGQRDSGWQPGQDGVSDYANVLAKGTYEWIQYLESVTDDLLPRYLAQSTNVIGPSRWLPTVAANATWSGGAWSGTSGVGFGLQAAIEFVPAGATIKSARFCYNRAGAGTVTRSLFRVPTATGPGSSDVIYTSTDTTTTGYQDFVATGIDHVVADGYAYALVVSYDGASDTAGAAHFAGGVTWI